ncbi:Lar family restriction alleviation protein [Cupriavidus basilensis]
MTESAERLEPCPCCGGTASFDHDDDGWNWIVCGSCGLSTDCAVSAMDDCRPSLREKWNRRAPAEAGVPAGWKLVPVEPTEGMVDAAIRERGDLSDIAAGRKPYPAIETRMAYRAMLAAAPAAPKAEKCWCQTCRPITMEDMRMVLCPTCGNKRCPRANDHRNACAGSNEAGQPGGAYPKQEKA